MSLIWPNKDPNSTLDYEIDWTAWLEGDPIATSQWTVPAGITSVSQANTENVAIITLSGGTLGTYYEFLNRITTNSGRIEEQKVGFLITEDGNRLVVLTNSFQTFDNARLLARDIPNLTGWDGTSDDDLRQTAMMEAFRRLTSHDYIIPIDELPDLQSVYLMRDTRRLRPLMWKLMTPTVFTLYAQGFRDSLNLAQVVEADQILRGDPIAAKRRAGLFSEKIGESSVMFRPGMRPVETRTSRVALAYVARYLDNTIKITRL